MKKSYKYVRNKTFLSNVRNIRTNNKGYKNRTTHE